jgi:glucan phosphoethanolaminetransferase (alkaline phosphatase superfamily)
VLVGAIFLINALIHGEVLLWVVTAVLGIFSLLVTIASLVRSVYHPNLARETRYASTQGKPTLILVVFLSASLVWWTALFRLFLEWFKPNGVDPTKRAVAVGVTMAYALVMQFGGRRLLREHFPSDQPEVLRSVEVTGLQAVVVFGVILLVSVFCVWLLV